jgi:LmbE family N-acetylglucosaminyl deacetylase
MFDKYKRILVLAPHTDDAELGCGGTIARLVQEKKEVFIVVFSPCNESLPKGFAKGITKKEARNAAKILGIDSKHLILKNYKVRNFPQVRQKILDDMRKIEKKIKPDLVFLPSRHSIHQDHKVIADEGLRAFKGSSCFGYGLPGDTVTFDSIAFVKLDTAHINKKIEAFMCYKSQLSKSKPWANIDEVMLALTKATGSQIKTTYAEVFEVMRLVI